MKDSGKRRQFSTGAVRDRADDKPRPDLISPFFKLREGAWLAKGGKKYKPRNWEQGMPLSEFIASLERHLAQLESGATDEDHAAAIGFNIMGFIHGQEMLKRGLWPAEFDDMPDYGKDSK